MSNAHTTYNSSAGREDERSRLCQLKVKDLLKELVARGVDVASLAALEKSELVDALLAAPPAALPRVVAMDAAEAEEARARRTAWPQRSRRALRKAQAPEGGSRVLLGGAYLRRGKAGGESRSWPFLRPHYILYCILTLRYPVGTGMALFFGGLVQLIAGQWEAAAGNTFGFTAFSGYGAFWLAYGWILAPGSGAIAAYSGDAAGLRNALGGFFIVWSAFTWVMALAAHRTNVGLFGVLLLTSVSFPLLAAASFTGLSGLAQAGGAVGIAASLVAWYTALSGLLTPESSYFTVPNPQL